jgi:O-antigen/teichoic acid export membrane protein
LGKSAGGGFDRARAKTYAGYGVPVALSLILALVLSTTDRFLIAAFLDEAAVGAYHAGYSLSNRTLDVVFIWLGAAGGPALIMALERGGPEALKAAAREQAGLIVLIALPSAVGLALVAAPLAHVMVGPALAVQAARVTPWIAMSGLFAGITTYYFAQAFTLAKQTRLLLVAMAIPALANIVLNLLLIPRLGLTGALAATLISYGVGMIAAWALALRAMPLPIPWTVIRQASLATAIMTSAVIWLPAIGGLAEVTLKACVGGAIYAAIILLLDTAGLRSRGNSLLEAVRARRAAA